MTITGFEYYSSWTLKGGVGLFESFVLLSPDVGATAADPLSEFCNDLATTPDEVFNNKLY